MNQNLYNLFSNIYSLYLKTQCYHWNVKGQNFLELHKLFESQYESLADDADEVAERIRSLGFLIPANLSDIQNSSSIKKSDEKFSSKQMIEDLILSYKQIVIQMKDLFSEFEAKKDISTIDLLTQKISRFEKDIWFLESFLN